MNKKVIIGLIIVLVILFIGIGEFIFYQAQDVTTENSVEENIVNNKTQNNISLQNNVVNNNIKLEENEMIIDVNNRELIVKLEDNSSSKALLEKLEEGNIVIDAHDYSNFEKVGELGFELPTNDKQITTKAGDVILYLGTRFVLYYDTNSWNFTKLGEVTNISGDELKDILGDGNVTMILKK